MSGIPGMGQHWQAALKIRVIMIPLPENTVAGAASGVCCSVKGCCRVSGSYAWRSLHIPSHAGGEKIINPWQGMALCPVVACGDYFLWKRDVRYRLWRKENHIHKLCDTVS